VLGGDPGIDRDAGDALGEILVVHTVEFTPDDNRIPGCEEAQFTRYRASGVRMVASDHHGTNASTLAAPDRFAGLGPGRVRNRLAWGR
jgi:hypothetical protein